MTRKTATRAGAAFFAVPAALMMASGPALAAEGGVSVSNTETVQAYLNASGRVDVARVYEQVAMKGNGSVSLSNPVETKGLRNLDGFGGFEVKDGNVVGTYQVDGERRLRTVSDYAKALPLEVEVRYSLDGKEVKPGDVVGRSGLLKVEYTVRNVTGKPQEVSFDDGTGKSTTATEDVVIPMVGSLSTVLPPTFTDVRSGEANMAGDGRGGTKMSFTMTLFGPIGKPEATFGYEARITDGVIPKASISALPVSPLDSPSFKGGAASYKGGAETGATLTAGATEIDANLLKLRDGAGDLLAGLIQLRDGANQLNSGLSGEAAPGARKLSDGAAKLKDGTGQLSEGAGKAKAGSAQVSDGAAQVADGAGQLADGLNQAGAKAPDLIDGLVQVSDGLDQLDAGLVTLYGGIGQLPAKAKPLHDGIAQLRAGLGDKATADTLIYGVEQVRGGLAGATTTGGPLDQLKGGVDQSKAGVDGVKGGLDGALATPSGGVAQLEGGVGAVKAGLDAALGSGSDIDQLWGGVNAAKATAGCQSDPVCVGTLTKVADSINVTLRGKTKAASDGLGQVGGGLTSLRTSLTTASAYLGQVSDGLGKVSPGLADLKTRLSAAAAGLTRVECGMDNTVFEKTAADYCAVDVDPNTPGVQKRPGLLQGLGALDGGVTQLVNGVVSQVQGGVGDANDLPADETLRGGVHGLMYGIDLIGEGGVTLIDGLGQLSDGADQLAAGSGDLADGAGQLDSGLGDLADGAGQLDDGASQLRDGAGKLADGLGDAADGSGKIADGLDKAAGGAPKLQDGAQRLSDEGTKKLIEAGKSTAADYGQKYALIEAGAKRAKAEGMAYGAPANAAGNTAYSYELAGMSGEGSRNMGRTAGAAAIFGLAGAAAFLRRRFVF